MGTLLLHNMKSITIHWVPNYSQNLSCVCFFCVQRGCTQNLLLILYYLVILCASKCDLVNENIFISQFLFTAPIENWNLSTMKTVYDIIHVHSDEGNRITATYVCGWGHKMWQLKLWLCDFGKIYPLTSFSIKCSKWAIYLCN